MQKTIIELSSEYKKEHPYTEEELTEMVLYCQKHPDSPKKDEYLVTIYWYYIPDIYWAIQDFYKPSGTFYDEEDVMEEAVVRLFDAIRTYQDGKGATFRTLASRIAKNTAGHFIMENSKKLRIPSGFMRKLQSYKQYRRKYVSLNQEEPSREQVKKDLGLGEQDLRRIELYDNVHFFSETSTKIEGRDIFDIPDENSTYEDKTLEEIVREEIRSSVNEILENCLDEEERKIICLRNGIGGDYHSLKETSDLLGLDETEILRRELQIREKLKNNEKFQQLAERLPD